MSLLFFIITLCAYILVTACQWLFIVKRLQLLPNVLVYLVLLLAVLGHAFLLYEWIDLVSGQNLTFCNIFSQVAWIVVVLMMVFSVLRFKQFNTLSNALGLIVYPGAALTIIVAHYFKGEHVVVAIEPKVLLHILISLLAFSILCIAALQAILLTIQDYCLRHKSTNKFLQALPPLETMEVLLFQLIVLGFILLSIVLLTSLWMFFNDLVVSALLQKTLLALLAWLVFGVLLLGRFCFAWRGQRAIRWTLVGFALLFLSYFVGQVLIEKLMF